MTTIKAIKEQITEILGYEATSATVKPYNPDVLNMRLKSSWEIVLENVLASATLSSEESEIVCKSVASKLEEPYILDSEGIEPYADRIEENIDYSRYPSKLVMFESQPLSTKLTEPLETVSESNIVFAEPLAITKFEIPLATPRLIPTSTKQVSINPEPTSNHLVILLKSSELASENQLNSNPKIIEQVPDTSSTTANIGSLTVLYLFLMMLVAAFLVSKWFVYQIVEMLVRFLLPAFDKLLTKSLLDFVEIIEYVFGDKYDEEFKHLVEKKPA